MGSDVHSTTTIERLEAALASMWTRQASWMPGGCHVDVGSGVLVMTDAETEGIRGALFLTGADGVVALERAAGVAGSRNRRLAVDLVRGRRHGEADWLARAGFERVASRRLMARAVADRASQPGSHFLTINDLPTARSVQQRAFAMTPADVLALYPDGIVAQNDSQVVVVVDPEETVVATATAHHDLGTIGVFGVATDPAHEGMGHGSAATLAAMAAGAQRGADTAWLQADDEVAGFYERLGFVAVDHCDVWLGTVSGVSE